MYESVIQHAPGTTLADAPTAVDREYVMRISRLTVDKLGIKLYDRVSAVLAELIANAYDADAENVTVRLPFSRLLKSAAGDTQDLTIVITDDGHGMSYDDVNKQYLKIGSDRRQRTGTDKSREKLRPVMGRKGIGKLAPFGICSTVEIITAGRGIDDDPNSPLLTSHLIMRLSDMLADTEKEYNPEIGALDGTPADITGTQITLRDFARKRVPSGDDLHRQLCARFGVARSDWNVVVENSLAPDEKFTLGALEVDVLADTKIDLSDRPVTFEGEKLPVSGWVAYSKHPYKDPAMAGVRIFARGKLVAQTRDFGIGAGFTGEFKLRSYLVGSINVEWLDEGDDLVRSDRQDIIWSSDLGEALSAWGQALMKELAGKGETSVRRRTWDEFLEVSNLEAQLTSASPSDPGFRDSVRSAARLLVKDKDRAALRDADHVKSVVQLAFMLAPQQTLLDALRQAALPASNTLDAVIGLFEKARIAEMYSLGQVASDRINVVERLRGLVNVTSTLERPLQELIEEAPWLLAPEWTPLGMNESLERVRKGFESWHATRFSEPVVTSAIEDRRREPDFVMLHDSGELWIVEIKRIGHKLTTAEFERGMLYLGRVDEYLDANASIGAQFPRRRLTFVVDSTDSLNFTSRSSLKADPRVEARTWREILDSTERAHKDFLSRVNEVRRGAPGATSSTDPGLAAAPTVALGHS